MCRSYHAYFPTYAQALQFDPTLRSEIEYDMKQFERAKKDKLAGKGDVVQDILLVCCALTIFIL